MGIAYFRVEPEHYTALEPLITAHEADMLGPRARGYWTERPDHYDYAGVQAAARALYDKASLVAQGRLELSENEAHSLSLLDLELPGDGLEFPPALFMSSASSDSVQKLLKRAIRSFGPTPAIAIQNIEVQSSDPRYRGYLEKQVRHLRIALPKVWAFFAEAGTYHQAVISVDLRARDVEIPESVEMAY
jgi:hypothetical protein